MDTNVKKSASERGIALIVVLLLMAVLSGLATGFAMNGQVEVQMGTNEVYFAGARAAAEAGLNRAIVEIIANTSQNFLSGVDGVHDSANLVAAVNADNGSIANLIGSAGPYALGTTGQYSYTIEILDDDNDALYEAPLTAAQVTQMQEDESVFTNANDRLILRATGRGPSGTTVRIARVLETVDTLNTTTTTTTVLSNPAILVNGNLEMNGAITVQGTSGSVHANGSLTKTGGGSGTVTGSATSSGTADLGGWTATGATGGGRPTINVPSIQASDYAAIADYKLAVVAGVGEVQTRVAGVWTVCTTVSCKGTGWSYSGGTWSSGSTPTSATYFAEGNVRVNGTTGSSHRAVSVIATGNIDVQANAKLSPENSEKIQFVCDGDFQMNGNVMIDDATAVEGQIMVRGQFEAGGSLEFQGRVMVQDAVGAGTTVGDGLNKINGAVRFTYNGTLGAMSTTTTSTVAAPTTYVNNVSGWMEQ